jgi:hypothetical protein
LNKKHLEPTYSDMMPEMNMSPMHNMPHMMPHHMSPMHQPPMGNMSPMHNMPHMMPHHMPAMPPMPTVYYTMVEPKFIEHLSMHKGQMISVTTVTGKLEGTLTEVAIDHLLLTINGVKHHIRYHHIVYFKKI